MKDHLRPLMSSKTPEYYTPRRIYQPALIMWGVPQFDLDPCSDSKHDPNIPAKCHYTQADDGLSQPWEGNCFVNPPYGRELIAWTKKAIHEHLVNGAQIVYLVPSRTETRWTALLDEFPRCYVKGRIQFINGQSSAPFPSALYYLGPHWSDFFDHYGPIGACFPPAVNALS